MRRAVAVTGRKLALNPFPLPLDAHGRYCPKTLFTMGAASAPRAFEHSLWRYWDSCVTGGVGRRLFEFGFRSRLTTLSAVFEAGHASPVH